MKLLREAPAFRRQRVLWVKQLGKKLEGYFSYRVKGLIFKGCLL